MNDTLLNNKIVDVIQFRRNNIKDVFYFTEGKLYGVTIPKCVKGIMIGLIKDSFGVISIIENDYIFKDENMNFHIYKPKELEDTKVIVNNLCEFIFDLDNERSKFKDSFEEYYFNNLKDSKIKKYTELLKIVSNYIQKQ